jgi:hypothetical protein
MKKGSLFSSQFQKFKDISPSETRRWMAYNGRSNCWSKDSCSQTGSQKESKDNKSQAFSFYLTVGHQQAILLATKK